MERQRRLTQLEAIRLQETMQREARQARVRRVVLWLTKGVLAAAVLLASMSLLYGAYGPQPWMAFGGLVVAGVMRAWWRSR